MAAPRFKAGSNAPRLGSDGRVFVPTLSGERQYLETAPPTSAVHGNPGFEDETAGVPDVWNFFWTSGTAASTSESAVVYSGSRSLRVDIGAGGGEQIVMSDVFDVAGGDRVDFSTFAVQDDGAPTIALGLVTKASGTPDFFDDGTQFNENSPSAVVTTWEQFSRLAVVPGGHTKARLFFRVSAADAATVYLDLTSSEVTASEVADTGWLELDFGAGWEAWTDTAVELPRCKRRGDDVMLVGNVRRTSGSDAEICTLPEELWPVRALNRGGQVVNGAGDGAVVIGADGVVTLTSAYVNGQFVGLDVKFPVDQD